MKVKSFHIALPHYGEESSYVAGKSSLKDVTKFKYLLQQANESCFQEEVKVAFNMGNTC